MAWTEDRIEKLSKLWDQGLTASQIAEQLGDVSRNAVIGKAHRLGLKSRPSPVKSGDKKDKKKKTTAKAKPRKAATKAADKEKAAPAAKEEPKKAAAASEKPKSEPKSADDSAPAKNESGKKPQIVSVGPGGFLRQGDQQAPIPPAPPRRLVPAKPSPDIADKTSLLDLNERICRWPMGHPGEPDFHFCGEPVNPGFPYCVSHCGRAYQAQLPRGARRNPPPAGFKGNRR